PRSHHPLRRHRARGSAARRRSDRRSVRRDHDHAPQARSAPPRAVGDHPPRRAAHGARARLAPRRNLLDRISVITRLATVLLALAAPLLIAADKPLLVPDISARQVQIRYSFTGAQLLLFGAIVYPGGRAPTSPADIVVV